MAEIAPATKDAYKLFHFGAQALARMEVTGLPVSMEALELAKARVGEEIRKMEDELRVMPEYQEQRRLFGLKTKLGSREQLAEALLRMGGVPFQLRTTKEGKYSLNDEELKTINTPYTQLYQRCQRYHKLKSTYLEGIGREVVNDRVHAFMNLHTVSTYRSSVDSPNIQNIPIRDPEIGTIIRSVVVPKPGHAIVEIDYSALEVHIAACYHKDPTMLTYLETGHDMHKDVAIECYLLDGIEKRIRTEVKSLFTFAEFYGDYYGSIARNLWKFAENYQMENGVMLVEHLKRKGITHLGHEKAMARDSYMQYIHDVDKRFWEQRFPVYDRWRQEWYRNYRRRGFFHTLTGFRVWGVFKRNEVINSPVQGSAFHCLLRSIIEIMHRIEAAKMGTRLVGQIHDSLVAEVPLSELDDYISMATGVMTTWLRKTWPWIIIDLKTEVEVGEQSWAAKKAYHVK